MNYIQYMQHGGPLTASASDKSLNDLARLDQNMQKALLYVPGLNSNYSYKLLDLNSSNTSAIKTLRNITGGRYNFDDNTVTIDPNYNTLSTAVHELEHVAQDQYNEKLLDKIWDKIRYYGGKVQAANSKLAKKYYQNKLNRLVDKYEQDRWYDNITTKKLNKLFDFDIKEVGATMREASSADWQGKSFGDLIKVNGYYNDIMSKYDKTLADKLLKSNNLYDNRLDYYRLKYYKEGISDLRRGRIYNRYQHLQKLLLDRGQRVRQRHDNKYLRFFKRFNNLRAGGHINYLNLF